MSVKRWTIVVVAALAGVLTVGLVPGRPAGATNPGTQGPLLTCADVAGGASVGLDDILTVAGKFGTTYPNAAYHPLYDLSGPFNSTGLEDTLTAAGDFGLNCQALSPVNTQIKEATLALLNLADPPGGQSCPGSVIVNTQNDACLAEHGYYQATFNVPGQGVHYVKDAYWDGVFDPTQPEGLVYDNGRLVASLYYVRGQVVGWGSEPPPPDQVNIDAFCSPSPCSWAGTEDGWHWHANLCTTNIGTTSASALSGVPDSSCPDEDDSGCPQAVPDCNRWEDRVGWMGHLWNHKLNPNGRFADCAPDETGNWKGFNCPQ